MLYYYIMMLCYIMPFNYVILSLYYNVIMLWLYNVIKLWSYDIITYDMIIVHCNVIHYIIIIMS